MKNNILKNNSSKIIIAIGVILIAAAVMLFVTGALAQRTLKLDASSALAAAEELLAERESAFPEERGNPSMPSMELEGIDVVGIIEVPKYHKSFALNVNWNKSMVKHLPCRYSGNIHSRDLVIGVTNGEGGFDFATGMDKGDLIYLTDMEGGVFTYCVEKIEHAKKEDPERFNEGDWDLTVFVKPEITGEYLIIRCRVQ